MRRDDVRHAQYATVLLPTTISAALGPRPSSDDRKDERGFAAASRPPPPSLMEYPLWDHAPCPPPAQRTARTVGGRSNGSQEDAMVRQRRQRRLLPRHEHAPNQGADLRTRGHRGVETGRARLRNAARRFWPEADPLGQRVQFRFTGAQYDAEVVGVVGDVRREGLDAPTTPDVYVLYAQSGFYALTLVVRARPGAPADLQTLKEQIWAVDPLQSIYIAARLDHLIAKTLAERRFNLYLLGGFAPRDAAAHVGERLRSDELRPINERASLPCAWRSAPAAATSSGSCSAKA